MVSCSLAGPGRAPGKGCEAADLVCPALAHHYNEGARRCKFTGGQVAFD